MKKERLQSFEALRGISIILLLALHSEIFDPQFFGEGTGPLAGVVATFLLSSFFFLAGYFTEYSIQKKTTALSFIKSKFIRIYPPYWVALLLFVYGIEINLKRFDFFIYVLNIQVIFSPVFIKSILTLWYISMLIVFYIIFCSLLFTIKSNTKLLISSVLIFAIIYFANHSIGLFDPRFFQYYFLFLGGIYFCRFEEMRQRILSISLIYKITLAIVSVILFWAVAHYSLNNFLYIFIAILFSLSWILLSLTILNTPISSWKIWTFLSTASFFAYLYHRPLWHFLNLTLGLDGTDKALFNLWLGAPLALLLGYFLQRGYDTLLTVLKLR